MDQPVVESVLRYWCLQVNDVIDLAVFRHTFSHFHLDITPCEVQIASDQDMVADEGQYQWKGDTSQLALAAPVTKLLKGKDSFRK